MSDPLYDALQSNAGPSQSNRHWKLNTPLGPDILLAERVVCEESIGPGNFLTLDEVLQVNESNPSPSRAARKAALQDLTGFRMWMTALSTDPNIPLDALRGKAVRLDWLTDGQPACVHGLVTRFELLGSDGGLARYALRIEPGLRMLKHRVDAWVFQSKSVVQIVDEVLSEHAGAWGLQWRWDLLNASVYPIRSLCVQYEESDLAFINRLLAEEGMTYWFEHKAPQGSGNGGDLGSHTLVISDHAGLLAAHPQGSVRYARSDSAVFKQDSLKTFEQGWRMVPTSLVYGSWDYRAAQLVHARVSTTLAQRVAIPCVDVPGAYAYESGAQAERVALRHLEALQMPARLGRAKGTWRAAALGLRWKLLEHPTVDARTERVTLALVRRGRSNLSAEQCTALNNRLGALPALFDMGDEASGASSPHGKDPKDPKGAVAPLVPKASEAPVYEVEMVVQEADLPLRAPWRGTGPDALFDRPRIRGVQTAVVVGSGVAPVHTDRDNRIKVQFHWQRGDKSSHRLSHSAGSNAPGTNGAGTWVRVAQSTASVNSGEVFVPRVGQEVIVTFVENDPDRPLVIGSVYGGRGRLNAQGNQVAVGPSTLTGNAPPWFGGDEGGHAHGAVLSGFKTQSLDDSASGAGAYSQLVLDDTPGESRLMLGSTEDTQGGLSSWLSLGHLLHQVDNQRLASRGHGLELITTGQGALRAGSGLHVSAHAKARGTQAQAHSMDACEAMAVLAQGQELMQALTDTAQQNQAGLPPTDAKTDKVTQAAEPTPKDLPAIKAQTQALESLRATDALGGEDGGGGKTNAWSRPELLLSAPGGIVVGTPAHAVYASTGPVALTAQQDVNLNAKRHFSVVVASGMTWFTFAQAPTDGRPAAETGMQLHAASGKVSMKSSNGPAAVKAKDKISVSSTNQDVTCSAPQHILLTAGGSALRIEPGKITITTMRQAVFKAQQRVISGPAQASGSQPSLGNGQPASCSTFQDMSVAAGGSAI